jgi:cbb3-type cytochrome oxidase maturation protein
MNIIILLISISLVIATGFLIAFLWNLKNGQYDDTYSPSVRMLFDDKPAEEKMRKHSPPEVIEQGNGKNTSH